MPADRLAGQGTALGRHPSSRKAGSPEQERSLPSCRRPERGTDNGRIQYSSDQVGVPEVTVSAYIGLVELGEVVSVKLDELPKNRSVGCLRAESG